MEEKVESIKELEERKKDNELQLIHLRDLMRYTATKGNNSSEENSNKTPAKPPMTFSRVVASPFRWFGNSVDKVFHPDGSTFFGVLGSAIKAYILLPFVILYSLAVLPALSLMISGIVKRSKEKKNARLLAYQQYKIETLEEENKKIDEQITEKTKEAEELLKATTVKEPKKKKSGNKTKKETKKKPLPEVLEQEVKGEENIPQVELFPDIKY